MQHYLYKNQVPVAVCALWSLQILIQKCTYSCASQHFLCIVLYLHVPRKTNSAATVTQGRGLAVKKDGHTATYSKKFNL